jgi:hypothetical protein
MVGVGCVGGSRVWVVSGFMYHCLVYYTVRTPPNCRRSRFLPGSSSFTRMKELHAARCNQITGRAPSVYMLPQNERPGGAVKGCGGCGILTRRAIHPGRRQAAHRESDH